MLQMHPMDLLEIFDGDRIGARPAALDEIDTELVQGVGDPDLVVDREVEILGLGAVTQGRIVDFYSSPHG